jgi:hypothetical protein
MRSQSLIQSSLSQTQREFMGFVERKVGAGDALYQVDHDSGLPGDTLRIAMTRRVSEDVSERRDTVEFMSLAEDSHWQAVGCIAQSLKETEGMQGRYSQIETRLQVAGPGVPRGEFAHIEVERVVQSQLDKLKAARLLPLTDRTNQ